MVKSVEESDAIPALLDWYDRAARVLPWRFRPGQTPDPYRVWLSEVMLQQTTVATVGPYFENFLKAWPTVADLAAANRDDVLANWAGLGYYARARNLHKCAVAVAKAGGVFPDTEEKLRQLPGIGPYTAAAVAAIAFDRPVVPVDGNIERVTARYFALTTPLPAVKPALQKKAGAFVSDHRPGDVAQSLMDLGATICTPRNPTCDACPLATGCQGLKKGIAANLPKRAAKKARPARQAVMFWLTRPDGRVLLERRPEKGLLGGMLGLPTSDWKETDWTDKTAISFAPVRSDWKKLPGTVGHTFTHFHLETEVWQASTRRREKLGEVWLHPEDFDNHAIPTLLRKIRRHAIKQKAAR